MYNFLPKSYRQRIRKSLADRGLFKTILLVYYERWIEYRYRISAGGIVNLDSLDIDSANVAKGVRYEGVNYYIFNEIMQRGGIDFANSTFLDFGCGKGQAMVFASDRPFRKLLGVEFSARLCGECRSNLESHFRLFKKLTPYEVYCCDAASYAIPDEVNVFFFFNPFDAEVLKKVLENIDESLRRFPRSITALYVNAIHRHVFVESGYRQLSSFHDNKLDLYVDGGAYVFAK